jgi:GH15 family glucan-1,4-alpha-glucosidase
MDLYTAAHRLSQRFGSDGEFSERALGEHALIGDGASCALVGVDGSIDWLCLPRFDSPSVFARILDPERGGSCRIAPADGHFDSLQAYDESTNVVQTLFRTARAVVQLTDFMPWSGDDERFSVHELHRMVEVREGSVELELVFDPRFDYGRGDTRVSPAADGALAEGPSGQRLALAVDGGAVLKPREQGGVAARVRLNAGQRLWAVLSWRQNRPEPIAAYRPFEQLRRTRRFWRRWASQLDYDGPWRHDVLRAALTLKLLQYAPTGAVVAAPTTSLPEWIGGKRNWDYRFSWTRDSAMAIRAMNLIGYGPEALRFFHFVRDCVDARGQLDIMVSIDGSDVMGEEVLRHLRGHRGSAPVRVGNAAAGQRQHDIVGPLLDAALLHENTDGMASLRLWREVRHLVDVAISTIGEPDHGIWEPRAEPDHHVHSKLMTWVAIDRALQLAPLFGGDREHDNWVRAHEQLRRDIESYGYDAKAQTFVGTYGGNSVDATLLLMPLYGFLPGDDPRVLRTLDRVRSELGAGRFLHRYRADRVDDGLDGEEGAFVLCGFWLAEALALAGRLDEALEVFVAQSGAANHVGLLAEEVDPSSGEPLGNFPQAFSHLGLIQTAARLDLALRQRDEGVAAAPLLPADLRWGRER